MNIETFHEPIRVLADCSGGRMDPIRFRWSGRTYRVEAINARWIDRRGKTCRLHFSVQSGDQTYLLHFDSEEVQWWLDQTAGQ
ncbi:MAG: hypothetical protein ACLFV7_11760 [Phycisphaerae bacterium]